VRPPLRAVVESRQGPGSALSARLRGPGAAGTRVLAAHSRGHPAARAARGGGEGDGVL